jgi:two-component sensor histidine kinase
VVVALLGSRYLKVRVGMGEGVNGNFAEATRQALMDAGISEYFSPHEPQHQMLHMSAPGVPAVSPVLLIAFTPGSTKYRSSLTHDVHTLLRKASANRIPIVGGGSADYYLYEVNYQVVNDRVSSDALAIAFIEAEILFGLGIDHGYYPTTRRALVTRAEGHIVHELDGRPAAQVYAELLGVPVEKLMEERASGPRPLTASPFGTTDMHGNSVLHVAERVFKDGSIFFPYLMNNHQVITLMRVGDKDVARAALSAYEKAVKQGGLTRPALAFMFSGALRRMGDGEQEEIRLVREKAAIPLCGCYSFAQTGVSDDGVPVYSNQSVSMLVFSDELNPVASLVHQGKRRYQEFTALLSRKASQIKSISRINQIIQDSVDMDSLLKALPLELATLFPWARAAFSLQTADAEAYPFVAAPELSQSLEQSRAGEARTGRVKVELKSHGKRFGNLILEPEEGAAEPESEELVLAETIGELIASGLHRIELDGELEARLQQLEILNQMAHELSKSMSPVFQLQNIVKHIRQVLGLASVSLWVVDKTHRLLVKEATDTDAEFKAGDAEKELDERLTKWQIEHQRPLFFNGRVGDATPIIPGPRLPISYVSLPVSYKGQLRGILNLYSNQPHRFSFQHDRLTDNTEFLKSIATELAVIVDNQSLQQRTTFYKEMHHRVKNNLQNIASLLRLQMRRLDDVSVKQALMDSISRITTIAVVHESLSQEEGTMVDVGQLVGRISKLAEAESIEGAVVTLDVSQSSVLIPSREATYLALVVNELVQNAFKHGLRGRSDGNVSVRITTADGLISVEVGDDGPGLPQGFDPDRDGNLGLTIVQTLVKDELKGQFVLVNEKGAVAKVIFPAPQMHQHLEERKEDL